MSRGALVVVACLGLTFGGRAHAQEPIRDESWKARAVGKALETRDVTLAPLALRTMAQLGVPLRQWWGRGDERLLAEHPELRAALEEADRLVPASSGEEMWARWKQDGYAASSDECAAVQQLLRSKGGAEAQAWLREVLVARDLTPPSGAPLEDWYYCVGVWDQPSVYALLGWWDTLQTHAAFQHIAPPMRAQVARRLLDQLASSPPPRPLWLIGALGAVKYVDAEVIAKLDAATGNAQLRSAAVSALAALVPLAPPGLLKEDRLSAWQRLVPLSAISGAFIAASPRLTAEVIARVERTVDCASLRTSTASLRTSKRLADVVAAKLASSDERARLCGELIGQGMVGAFPELRPPLLAALRTTKAGAARADTLAALIDAGAVAEVASEVAAYYEAEPRNLESMKRLSEALAGKRIDPSSAATMRAALLSYMKAQAPGWEDEHIGLALLSVGPISRLEALGLLERTHGGDPGLRVSDIHALRFWAIAASGGDSVVTASALRFAARSRPPSTLEPKDARDAMESALEVLKLKPQGGTHVLTAPPLPDVDAAVLAFLRAVLDDARWTKADVPFLRGLLDKLPEAPELAALRTALERRIAALEAAPAPPSASPSLPLLVGRWAVSALGVHFLVWLGLLLVVYPRSRLVQAAMLFNPLGRAVTGLGYTQLLVLVSPWLRRRLFHPLVDGGRDTEVASYDAASFYAQIRVAPILPRKNPQAPVELGEPIAWTTLAALEGLTVIEGASGLGKTHVLKALLERSRAAGRTCLFIRAAECNGGVMKEIEDRLAMAHSSGFVRSMVHRGAIELFLDGLNEAQPGGVAEIAQFCERAPNARILITTQPMSWACPRRARRFRLLPLEPDELEAFLMSQWPAVRIAAPAAPAAETDDEDPAKDAYRARVQAFLAGRTGPRDLAVLQNRIDLAFVAHVLARGQRPNIHSLRKQVVDDAAAAYEAASPGGAFPLAELGAAAVRVLESGNPVIDPEGIDLTALAQLADRKLLLHRGDGAWLFRHDTITCYFAAQGVFAPLIVSEPGGESGAEAVDPRAVSAAHLASPRFLGVYLQLAESLPRPAAEALASALRDHGRDSHDRTLEIAYQDLLDRRAD